MRIYRNTARENHSPLVTLNPPGSGPYWWKASAVSALATVPSLLVAWTLSFMLLLARLLHGDGEIENGRKFKSQPRSQGLFPILSAGREKIGKRPWERGCLKANRCILKNVVKICVKRLPSSSSFLYWMYSCITLTGFGVTLKKW